MSINFKFSSPFIWLISQLHGTWIRPSWQPVLMKLRCKTWWNYFMALLIVFYNLVTVLKYMP